MVPVRLNDGSDCLEGMTLLQQMVLARAFPGVALNQLDARVPEVFDSPETLQCLCQASGGHVRNLLMLLYSCLQQDDPPISRNSLETVIKGYRDDLSLGVTDEQWNLLRQVAQQKTVEETPECQALLRSLFVFEYRSSQERWFDVNPVLAESKELQR
jgi:hypothetical protein